MTLNCHCEESLLCTISELCEVFRCCCRKQSQLRVSKVEFLVEFSICAESSASSFNQQHSFGRNAGENVFSEWLRMFLSDSIYKKHDSIHFQLCFKGGNGSSPHVGWRLKKMWKMDILSEFIKSQIFELDLMERTSHNSPIHSIVLWKICSIFHILRIQHQHPSADARESETCAWLTTNGSSRSTKYLLKKLCSKMFSFICI